MLGQDSKVDKRNVMLGAPKGNCPGSTEEMLGEKFGDGGVHAIARARVLLPGGFAHEQAKQECA
jgi:hypothetical protein